MENTSDKLFRCVNVGDKQLSGLILKISVDRNTSNNCDDVIKNTLNPLNTIYKQVTYIQTD